MRWLAPLLVLATAASAQPSWSELTPGAGATALVGDALAPWAAGPGITVRVEAPAYGGRARVEVRAFDFEVDDERLPEFALVVPTVGWGPALAAGPMRLALGARVGAGLFRLDDDDAGNLQNETELAVGGWAGAALRLGRAEVWAEVGGMRLTLSDPATPVGVTAGLAVRLGTPGWLRGVLE